MTTSLHDVLVDHVEVCIGMHSIGVHVRHISINCNVDNRFRNKCKK